MPERTGVETAGRLGRIAVVDDDDLFRESLSANLEEAGYQVSSFADGAAALSYLAESPPVHLVLLDWRMPGMSGIEVLRSIRERGLGIPVIFLTVLGDQIFEEAALAGGAVDFIEKSRSFAIIHRRIALHVDESPGTGDGASEDDEIEIGTLSIKPRTKRAAWSGHPVPLTLTEFEIVQRLSERAGEDVSFRELYDLVRGEGFHAGDGEAGYRANVRAIVKRIRQKFRDIDPAFDQIANYPGFGYRWNRDAAGDA